MDNNNTQNNFNNTDEETIDLRKIFNYFIGNIHWFIISVVVTLGIAHVVNRYTTRIYNISTTILIEDNTKGSSLFGKNVGGSLDMLSGFGMYPSLQNFENQSIIIQSYSQIRRTIDNLNFEVSYYRQGRISKNEIYNQSPFEIIYFTDHPQILNANFNVSIDNDGFINLSIDEKSKFIYNYDNDEILGKVGSIEFKKQIKPGERVQTEFFDFYIKIKKNFDPNEVNNYFFFFNAPHFLTLAYQNKLSLEPMAKGASMLKISIEDNNTAKAVDFLNMLSNEYLLRNLEKKNELANNTIHFIDTQLDTISKSLNIAETDLETFRYKNKVMDLSFQAQQIFEQLQKLEDQKMALEMQAGYYQYLLDYIEENQDAESILAPSAMGVQDPLLNQLILEINQLSIEKSSLTNIKKGADLMPLQRLDANIRNAKNNIYENALNLVKNAKFSLREINKRIAELTRSINNLPETERELFGIKRKFELNDNLYTYLLERRAEAQIAKASNSPDNQVIDFAMTLNGGRPIKPKSMINYLIALMLGLIIPAVSIALSEYFNMRIDSPDKIKQITNKPIIGYIPNSGEAANINIFDNPDSPWAESFRIVRTKMQFITKNIEHPVIMITSSIPGEGKSFISINLASANALTGKKTVLVGMDLRRPQLAQRFGLDKDMGFTNYLIGEATLDEIIQKTQNPFLDIIPSGVIPPNPAELIADNNTALFIEEIKKRYDYIIIDSAPMSPVSDSHHLARLVDATIFVVRDKYTHRQAFANSIEEAANINIQNLSIIMNDIKLSKRRIGGSYGYNYGYKYGYKFGYGYGYGNFDKKAKKKNHKS
ncbi:MAG TPA: polysaccharide biosynthesis tyrosine autokinase [Prolixibacteraceae bacterium]|nr:polysaccharide biosynthesis tyrosine autokinase [Prolixibacteraceae bacterium]